MFTRKNALVLVGILLMSCIYLMGQEAWPPPEPAPDCSCGGMITLQCSDDPGIIVTVTDPHGHNPADTAVPCDGLPTPEEYLAEFETPELAAFCAQRNPPLDVDCLQEQAADCCAEIDAANE